MDKEELKNLVNNPDFIPGIFNYCDRWCERCPYTTRCANFAISDEQFSDPESKEIENTEFWNKLNEIFQVTIDLIKEGAEEAGIDLEDLEVEITREEREVDREEAKSHELALSAKKYAEMVKDWFDEAETPIKQKEQELNLRAEIDSIESDPVGESFEINDAIEVIQWYHLFIYPKIMRALDRGEPMFDDDGKEFPSDSDGSAKIALIAMDRSIAAWGTMYRYFPEKEDEILEILVFLDRMKKKTEAEFPKARAFVRPGFDENPKHEELD